MSLDRLQCPVAEACGGCALIGRPYAEQLRVKRDRVREAFAATGSSPEAGIEDCMPAPQREAYRNRAKLAVARESGRVRIGLHRRGSNRVVDLAPCRVQQPVLQRGIERIRDWLSRHRLARPEGPVIYIDLRAGDGEDCHLTLVLDGKRFSGARLVETLREDWPGLRGIAVNHGSADSSYPLGDVTETAWGEESILTPLPRRSGTPVLFEVPATGFFQVAPAALEETHDLMSAHLGTAGPLFDLFCGVGVHGIAMTLRQEPAARDSSLVGVEGTEPLVAAARRNAARLGVPASYVAGRVETVLEPLLREQRPRRVILNPGRSGLRPRALARLGSSSAERVAYLSCNPTTLARDLADLSPSGLRATRIVPLDLMPQTDHVEVLALLDRKPTS